MAALSATLLAAAPAAATAAKPATGFTGLAKVAVPCKAAPAPALRAIANDVKTRQMKVWQPTDNKYFETFSYLPPLTQDQIAKQVDYMISNAWVPCIEFAEADKAYVAQTHSQRMGPVTSTYEDNRYWTMFKLPMFGCNDPSQVLREMENAIKAFPNAYIRLVAFDAVRQCQLCGFLLHRPPNVTDYRPVEERSV